MRDARVSIITIGFACTERCDAWTGLKELPYASLDIVCERTLHAAIERLNQQRSDVAFFDPATADGNGIKGVCRLRKEVPEVPVVVLTANDQQGIGLQAIQQGAHDYLPERHFCGETLWRTIRNAIERSKNELQIRTMVDELATSQAMHAESLNELESASRELIRLNEEANQARLAKGEFLAHMSHEIRTPMTAILGYADVLLDQLRQPDEIDAAQTIRRNADHLLHILSDILDLSRAESGRLELQTTDCSPVDVVDDVMDLMRVRAEAKGIDLRCEYHGPIPERIATDPARLKQMLINLVGNAVKFTEIGGVCLNSRFDLSDPTSPQIRFEVVDTGIGIEASYLDRVFDPFSQADYSMSRRFGGSGLGLAICQRLADMLGGNIDVTSQVGVGSTFTFSLPISANTSRCVDSAACRTPTVKKDRSAEVTLRTGKYPNLACRVLLAEDGPDNQQFISLLLRKSGADVTIAENGKKAVEMAMTGHPDWGHRYDDPDEPFDLVLMDMQMPVMDGYRATRKLRELGFDKPIIAITAHALSDDRQNCLDAGCDDYLPKPIDRDLFLQIVSDHTSPRRTLPPNSPSDEIVESADRQDRIEMPLQ